MEEEKEGEELDANIRMSRTPTRVPQAPTVTVPAEAPVCVCVGGSIALGLMITFR